MQNSLIEDTWEWEIAGYERTQVGWCGRCRGRVMSPRSWAGSIPPPRQCEDCHSHVRDKGLPLPTFRMKENET